MASTIGKRQKSYRASVRIEIEVPGYDRDDMEMVFSGPVEADDQADAFQKVAEGVLANVKARLGK